MDCSNRYQTPFEIACCPFFESVPTKWIYKYHSFVPFICISFSSFNHLQHPFLYLLNHINSYQFPSFFNMTVTDINLFKPLKVGNFEVTEPIALAPLTRFRAPNHLVTDLQPVYYSQRSSSPGTLLISEATFISEAASGYDTAPGIYNEEQVKAWSKVTNAMHAKQLIFLHSALDYQSF